MKTVNFAVIGTNYITDRLLGGAQHCPEFKLKAVYSRSLERAREFGAKYGAELFFDSLEELAACSEVDAVYIASPNFLHAPQAEMMLKAGKHVLGEKPSCSNAAELESMLAAAKESGCVYLEAMRPLYVPGLDCLKKAMERIAPIRRAHITFCQYSSRYDKFKNGIIENTFRPEMSNGALLDIGSYCVAVAAALFGAPERIQSSAVILPGSIDACGTALCDYPGMTAELTFSKVNDRVGMTEIQGEGGCINIDDIGNLAPMTLTLRGGQTEALECEVKDPFGMYHEMRTFIDCIQGKADPAEYNELSRIIMNILDTVRAQCGIVFPADKK